MTQRMGWWDTRARTLARTRFPTVIVFLFSTSRWISARGLHVTGVAAPCSSSCQRAACVDGARLCSLSCTVGGCFNGKLRAVTARVWKFFVFALENHPSIEFERPGGPGDVATACHAKWHLIVPRLHAGLDFYLVKVWWRGWWCAAVFNNPEGLVAECRWLFLCLCGNPHLSPLAPRALWRRDGRRKSRKLATQVVLKRIFYCSQICFWSCLSGPCKAAGL